MFETLGAIVIPVLILAGLGLDNGVLIDISLKKLGLEKKKHFLWRTIALFIAAGLRIGMLYTLTFFAWLRNPLPESWYAAPIRVLSPHPEKLEWLHFIFFLGGLTIVFMAFWEVYHKYHELSKGHGDDEFDGELGLKQILGVASYLLLMNIIFSVDSVFSLLAMMDIETQFNSMVTAVVIACVLMIVFMVPLGKLITENIHFATSMLSILIVIACKLLVDGVGGHFPNSMVIFIIAMILLNDFIQGLMDKAIRKRSISA